MIWRGKEREKKKEKEKKEKRKRRKKERKKLLKIRRDKKVPRSWATGFIFRCAMAECDDSFISKASEADCHQ